MNLDQLWSKETEIISTLVQTDLGLSPTPCPPSGDSEEVSTGFGVKR